MVIGGGNAGLSVAGRLRRMGVQDIVVVEPQTQHHYKPLFSHIAGGAAPSRKAVRAQSEVMPRGVGWVQDAVTSVDPRRDLVQLRSGSSLSYDQLIVCPGIHQDWDAVPGLADAMASPSGASNYVFDLARKESELLRDLRSGTVVFCQPPGPASCAGAAQKPMYLACDYWRATGVLADIRVVLVVPDATVFGIAAVDRELERKIAEYGIELHTRRRLADVDVAQQVAVLASVDGADPERIPYDVLSVEPPQSAPAWLAASDLGATAEPGAFVEVDPHTLRHARHPNIWALGDAAATMNSKSGGALRKQTLVVAKNVVAVLRGRAASEQYDGYSVCPFTVSRRTVVFAEFDDRGRLQPTIPFWKTLVRERRLTWIFDRHILPWVYWHMILKGRA